MATFDDLDTRTKKILRRAQRLNDMQREVLLDEVESTLDLMGRVRQYAEHMEERWEDVWQALEVN